MRVGVTGATGLLGGYIVRRLAGEGHEVRALAREASDTSVVEGAGGDVFAGDMTRVGELGRFVKGCGAVVHAALVDWEEEDDNFEHNLVGSLRLMELCRREGAQFVFVSSGAVHDRIIEGRGVDETHPLWAGNTYGAYKAAVEAFLPAYKSGWGFNACALRPTAIYGVHLTRPEKSLWYELIEKVTRGEEVEAGSGRKVIHAADVAEVAAAALGREDVAGESYELTDCWVHERTVAEFAAEAAGVDAKVSGAAGAGPKHETVTEKARRTFGEVFARGEDGVREYVGELVEIIGRD